jgi:phage shock protein PspC (stress-responsive transcriptional regulator)
MGTFKQKLSSRKLWAAVVGILTGIAMIFGLDGEVIETVSGAVVAVGSIVAYIAAEGKIDAERVKGTVGQVKDAIEVLDDPQ